MKNNVIFNNIYIYRLMNILFICCSSRYECVNETYKNIVETYTNKGKYTAKIIYTDNTFTEKEFCKYNPDLVIFFDIDEIRFGNKFNFVFSKPVFVCSLDYFYFGICSNCKWIRKCSGIITFPNQEKIMNSYRNIFPNKKIFSFNGRFFNNSIYKNYNLEKKYDILIYGTRHFLNNIEPHFADQEYKKKWEKHNNKLLPKKYHFYPLRVRIENLLLKHTNKYKIKILMPSGSLGAKKNVNEKLSELINSSWMTLCTSSRCDILMDKYIESAASYSAILGNIPSDYTHIFKNNIIEITEWMSDEEILSIIDTALENKEKLKEIINKTATIVENSFDLNNAVKNMDNVFDEILKTML